MKKRIQYFVSIILAVVLIAVIYTASMSFVKSRTISFIPDDVTQFLYLYLDTCMTHPEDAIDYVHFESEVERNAFSHSHIEIQGYEILGAQKINDNLYAFTLSLKKAYETYPKRYYFVGSIDNKLYLMVNAGNVPEVLQDGFNEDDFTLTSKDLNGGIPVSPDSIC